MKNKVLSIALTSVAAVALIGAGVAAYGQSVSAAAAQVRSPARRTISVSSTRSRRRTSSSYFKNSPAIVIVSQQNGSKNLRDAAPALKALKDTYAAQGCPGLPAQLHAQPITARPSRPR